MLTSPPFDASHRDGVINFAGWPALGMHQPDAIASHTGRGKTYLLTANEGDARDYAGFSEEARVEALPFDAAVFPDAAVGPLGPGGLPFIPARRSPNRQLLLVVGNEVSGTATISQVLNS